ncbi:MAG: cysteine synthase family protein [Candidatus Micrarchaeota archaeon]
MVIHFTLVYENVLELVGNTPIVRLKQNPNVLLKLEKFNPGASVKDRPALEMVCEAEQRGILKKGGKIVESSSGNLAVSLALVSVVKGYKFIAVVDSNISPNKLTRLRAYGANVKMVTGGNVNELKRKRRELTAAIAKNENAICLDQYNNPANPQAHTVTAREILTQVPNVDIVVTAVSTGGQFTGIARALLALKPSVKMAAVEPNGSVIFGGKGKPYFSDGSGLDYVGRNFEANLSQWKLKVGDAAAFKTAKLLAKTEGILIGSSSGRVVYAGLKLQKKYGGLVVCVCPDGGEDYPILFNETVGIK